MNDGADAGTLKLAELLRHPDDLDKISALKSDFARRKAAVDVQLKLGLKEQLQLTQAGMTSLQDGQKMSNQIKEEMMKIDRLCAEAQNMIRNFPEINAVAQAHRNFTQVEAMKNNIESFNERLDYINRLLREDAEDLETQPNLINIHYGISQLRNVRDEAMEQVKKANDTSLEGTLMEHFKRLDDAVDEFDEHVGTACIQLIPLVQSDNTSLVVRLAIIVEEEEKFDNRIKELQEAQKEFKDLAQRFQSLNTGPKELRGYKDKFLEAIKLFGQGQIDNADEMFMDDPEKLEKSMRWFFNDLNLVKLGMTRLMPKKWKIFKTYVGIYHQIMNDYLTSKTEDKNINPTHMLAIIHWKEKYYQKMNRLGVMSKELTPDLPGGQDSELVREYRQLIIDKVEQWVGEMNKTDERAFKNRDESALDHDEHNYFRTKTLPDLWRMLREQLVVASTSELTDVTEAVTDAMYRALVARQDMWTSLINAELERYAKSQTPEVDAMQGLQDWLVALANDQIACIDDAHEDEGQFGYLSSFRKDYESVVSSDYAAAAEAKYDSIKAALTDLGFRSITVFVKLIFVVDFRTVMPEFFTSAWYNKTGTMGQIVTTFEDYLSDYSETMPDLLRDILIEEFAKQLLISYLASARNKGARYRRGDPFAERVKEDILAVFNFFQKYPTSFENIKQQWRVVEWFTRLLEVDKHALIGEFEELISNYWDLRLSWIEAVLRMREDVDFGPLGDGKSTMKSIRAKAADMRLERGEETILNEVD